uniref:ABC transporter substrate-binding protein n=1 Tax=Ignisphaera aggregans TaxID=334771 RepID=A0A7J3QFK5_9CREN
MVRLTLFQKVVIAVIIIAVVVIGTMAYYFYYGPGAPRMPSEFKLGAVLDYTGVFAACAKAEEIGMKIAIEEINAKGGLFGRIPIVLITRDGESKPEVQIRRFRELVEVEKVHAALGTCHAGGAYSLMKESLTAGIPYWPSPVMAWEAFKKEERAPWTFGVWTPTWSVGYAMCYWAVTKLNAKNVYFFARTDAWGWGIRDGCKAALEKYGGTMVGYDEFTLGTPDYTPYITRMIAAKPDIIVSTTFGGDQVTFLKQAYELGLHKVAKIMVFTSHLVMKGIPPEALKDVYAVAAFYHDLPAGLVDDNTYKLIRNFTNKVKTMAGEPPDPYTVANYVAVLAMSKAFEKLGKIENIKPEEFEKAVMELGSIPTPKGELRFTKAGTPIYRYAFFLGIGKGPGERTYEYDYLNIIDVFGGEELLPPLKLLGYE